MAIKMRALAERFSALCAVALGASVAVSAMAGPDEVKGPGFDPGCFAPRDSSVKYLKYPTKKGPFKIALVNGYVGNAWRIQMVQTAKAYAGTYGADFQWATAGSSLSRALYRPVVPHAGWFDDTHSIPSKSYAIMGPD